MATLWMRNGTTTPVNNGTWGHWHPSGAANHVLIGETALRTYWDAELWATYGETNQYPPGSSLIRVGLIMLPPGTQEADIPSPLSQGGEDWMDVKTVHPQVQLAQSVSTAWQLNWSTGEQDVKSMRRARELDLAAFVVWEMEVGPGAVQDFVIAGWNVAVDQLVQTPDTTARAV